jgi:hypothetical protein
VTQYSEAGSDPASRVAIGQRISFLYGADSTVQADERRPVAGFKSASQGGTLLSQSKSVRHLPEFAGAVRSLQAEVEWALKNLKTRPLMSEELQTNARQHHAADTQIPNILRVASPGLVVRCR